jgi:4-amino-4-deoxy-L-arabinose transferase-like glycosyltransferase
MTTRANGHFYPWIAVLALALAAYTLGLGGQYVPSNGDELVYAHIARVTAQSGHWLPLASELDNMRNTKPPLLFWQAIVAGQWGQNWTLLALRLPSLLYTLLITAAVAWSTLNISGDKRRALIAACVYLGFFCTFRYGRSYLTSAPETFWLDLPLFGLLWYRLQEKRLFTLVEYAYSAPVNIAIWVSIGIAWGLGSAYKSFALIAPASAALWVALLLSETSLSWRLAIVRSLQVLFSASAGLAIFSLWFVLDPDPAAVWKEFVIGENAGKLVDPLGYWHEALHGGDSSLWAQALAYVQNAGLLAFVVLGLAWVGSVTLYQRLARRAGPAASSVPTLPAPMWILFAWLGVWLVVFSIPSARSARYVIPAMPALAILIALYWERIARGWFVATLVLTGVAILAMARISWVAQALGIASAPELAWVLLLALIGAGAIIVAVLIPRWTRACAITSSIVFYACFNLTTAPLEGPSGRYSPQVSAVLQQQRIAVPSNFNAQYERFQFLLPGNRFVSYDLALLTEGDSSVAKLKQFLASYDAVVWGPASADQTAPACLPDCMVLASRWVVKERHKRGEITMDNLWYPGTWLFSREWLLKRAS